MARDALTVITPWAERSRLGGGEEGGSRGVLVLSSGAGRVGASVMLTRECALKYPSVTILYTVG